MKRATTLGHLFIFIVFISFTNSCTKSELDSVLISPLEQKDKEALLFMLEEEKLARDTYTYIDNLWSINQFANIKKSEQNHINAISTLLTKSNVEHTVLPAGVFANQDLQNLYNQFVIDGAISVSKALQIGATIEDLDIVDLEKYKKNTTNSAIINVYNNLLCGSRNHIRSFVKAIINNGDSYTPQYLTQTKYNSIITASQEQCN